jgi:hypothetical protein
MTATTTDNTTQSRRDAEFARIAAPISGVVRYSGVRLKAFRSRSASRT